MVASAYLLCGREEAKRALRALLERPDLKTNYPPADLRRALSLFGDEVLEAAPILVERLGAADFETRTRALFGI